MINYQTILSNYNKRGTLLKWLRTLQTALEEGALETVTTTTTEDSVVFHFCFADGTSLDSPPIQLEAGPPGTAATIEIGNVSTLPAGSDATVVNTGSENAAVLDFGIPQGIAGQDGQDGIDGAAATIAVGTVSTLPAGSPATVTNSGTSSAAVFNFGIPQGANGDPGEVIDQIVTVETTTIASRAYSIGDYFVNSSGILCKATANIALGATIDSTNSSAVNATISDQLASLENSLNDSGSSYCKLPDGTLIQFGYLSLGSHSTTQSGALYITDWTLGADEGLFGIPFVGSYAITVAPTDGSYQIITALESNYTKIIKIGGGRPTSGNVNGNFRYIAIGRWK